MERICLDTGVLSILLSENPTERIQRLQKSVQNKKVECHHKCDYERKKTPFSVTGLLCSIKTPPYDKKIQQKGFLKNP